MALNPLHEPPAISPARDPIWYEVFCSGHIITAGVRAAYTIDLTSMPVADQTFSISIDNITVTFTWVSGAADESGQEIQVGTNLAESRANFLLALQGNWQINEWFAITAAAPIELSPRIIGATGAQLVNTSPSTMIWAETTAGTTTKLAPNYRAMIRVWVEKEWDSDEYTALPAMEATPDADERARWNLRGMLLPYVQNGYRWPTYGATEGTLCTDIQRRYYVERYEEFGDPPMKQRIDLSTVKRAWYAGSRRVEHNTIGQFFTLVQGTDPVGPWLTYRSRAGRHEVSREQQHYLSFYRATPLEVGVDVLLRVKITYSDGTTSTTDTVVGDNVTWKQGMVLTIPMGFDTRELNEVQPTKTPVKYDVVLRTAAGPISEWHLMHLVDTDANEQHIEYINSLGVVESLRGGGRWELGVESDHVEVVRLVQMVNTVAPSPQQSARAHITNGGQKTLQWTSGYLSRGEFNAVVDVLFSPEHRALDHARATRVPLRLVGAQHVMKVQGESEAENLYALNLSFLMEDPELAWSDVINVAGYVAPDPEDDEG